MICAGTTGCNLTLDARFLWMRQKRVQGSHFAHLYHASQANQLVIDRRIDPAMSEVRGVTPEKAVLSMLASSIYVRFLKHVQPSP